MDKKNAPTWPNAHILCPGTKRCRISEKGGIELHEAEVAVHVWQGHKDILGPCIRVKRCRRRHQPRLALKTLRTKECVQPLETEKGRERIVAHAFPEVWPCWRFHLPWWSLLWAFDLQNRNKQQQPRNIRTDWCIPPHAESLGTQTHSRWEKRTKGRCHGV